MNFSKVTIIGLGLIGGSLAWALKKSEQVGEVFGVDLDGGAIDYAIHKGIIDNGSTEIENGIKHSEVVVIATYVGIIPKIARSVAAFTSPGTIITDVGSVKAHIVKQIEGSLPLHLHFVGGHPIAGTERSGIWVANFRLFKEKRCILTPTERTHPEALSKIKALWEAVGARVFLMDVETHDRIFGFVSHLPHAVAYALVNSVASVKDPANILDFAGGGLKDYIRIGGSSPNMWSDIFLTNKGNVLGAIDIFKGILEKIRGMIEKEDVEGLKEEFKKSVEIKNELDKT